MKRRVMVATVLVVLMTVLGVSSLWGQAAKDTLVVAIPDAPVFMDPHTQATLATYRVTTQMFDRLVTLDEAMNVVPALAESWTEPDDKTTIFKLRKGVKFHDGTSMKASDVKFSLERCMASPGVNYNYLIIATIDILDDYTIKITTKQPFNALLYRLTLDAASIVSTKAAQDTSKKFNDRPVGAGPYKFVSWTLGGDIVLEAFDDYYRGKPPVKRIIFRHIPEAINRTVGLETGEIDIAYDLAITDLARIKKNAKLKVLQAPSFTMFFLGFNVKRPIMDNLKVRQAIARAVKVEDVISIAWSGVADVPHMSVLTPTIMGYAPDTVTFPYDVAKAKQALAEAGYPKGFKTTLYCTDNPVHLNAAVAIQDQLRQIGIDVEVKSMDLGTFTTMTGKGAHDMAVFNKTGIDPDSVLRAQYYSASFGLPGNRAFWSSPEVDAKLDRAAVSQNKAEVLKLYKEIQTIVAEQVPYLPLANPHINAGTQATVEGFMLYKGNTHSIYGARFVKK